MHKSQRATSQGCRQWLILFMEPHEAYFSYFFIMILGVQSKIIIASCCIFTSWGLIMIDRSCLIPVYWIPTPQPSSNDQSALMHPYCVYKCELIYIAAKHPQDIERAPLEPNTNYICLFLGKWPLSTLDRCKHQRSDQYISTEKLVCHQTARLPATNLLLPGMWDAIPMVAVDGFWHGLSSILTFPMTATDEINLCKSAIS